MSEFSMHNFTKFINDLEWHAQHTDTFFDGTLLRLLSKAFGFRDLAINIYHNSEYVGTEAYGRITALVKPYQQGFYRQDFVSRYVCEHIGALVFDEKSAIVQSNRLNDPDGYALYCSFLNMVDIQYSAVLPINENFRLVTYKNREQGEFSDIEIMFLNYLLSVIRNKYQTFLESKNASRSARIVESLLDNMSVGYVILDEDFQPVSHNVNSIQYLQDLFQVSHISKAIPLLVGTLNGRDEMDYKQYHISMSCYTEVNGLNIVRKYFYISIVNRCVTSFPCPLSLHFELLTARELEVLDYFSKGCEYGEISKVLFISEGTLKTHLKNIYRKLNVSNQRRLVYEYSAYLASFARGYREEGAAKRSEAGFANFVCDFK